MKVSEIPRRTLLYMYYKLSPKIDVWPSYFSVGHNFIFSNGFSKLCIFWKCHGFDLHHRHTPIWWQYWANNPFGLDPGLSNRYFSTSSQGSGTAMCRSCARLVTGWMCSTDLRRVCLGYRWGSSWLQTYCRSPFDFWWWVSLNPDSDIWLIFLQALHFHWSSDIWCMVLDLISTPKYSLKTISSWLCQHHLVVATMGSARSVNPIIWFGPPSQRWWTSQNQSWDGWVSISCSEITRCCLVYFHSRILSWSMNHLHRRAGTPCWSIILFASQVLNINLSRKIGRSSTGCWSFVCMGTCFLSPGRLWHLHCRHLRPCQLLRLLFRDGGERDCRTGLVCCPLIAASAMVAPASLHQHRNPSYKLTVETWCQPPCSMAIWYLEKCRLHYQSLYQRHFHDICQMYVEK